MSQQTLAIKRQWRRFARLSTNVGWLTTANILHLCILLAATIFLGRASGPDAVGLLSLATAAGSIMQAVSSAGLHTIGVAALLDSQKDQRTELRTLVLARLIVIPFIFIAGAALFFTFINQGEIPAFVLILFFAGYAVGAFDVGNMSHMAQGNFRKLATRQTGVILLLAPFVVWSASTGALEIVLILLAIETAALQIASWPGSGIPTMSTRDIRMNVVRGLKAIWTARSMWASSLVASVAQRIDIFIVAALIGMHATGQYSTASRPIEATTMFAGSLVTVLFNSMARNRNHPEEYSRSAIKSSRIMLLASLATCAAMVIAGPFLVILFYGKEFGAAAALVPLYALSIVFIFQKQLIERVCVLENRYSLILHSHVIFILANVGLNFALVPQMGIEGAAISSIVAHVLSIFLPASLSLRGRNVLVLSLFGAVLPNSTLKSALALIDGRRP